jgi:hypothetical protein
MKVNCTKKGSKWNIVLTVENIDPAGMSVAGNFNDWSPNIAKSSFAQGKRKMTLSLPEEQTVLEFKLYDMTHDCWCDVSDNGSLYAGLERFQSRNSHGSIISIPLSDIMKS